MNLILNQLAIFTLIFTVLLTFHKLFILDLNHNFITLQKESYGI